MEGVGEPHASQASQWQYHKKLSTRVYCVDIVRAVCILGMTLVHSYSDSIDLAAIFKSFPFIVPILVVVCIFTQFRGFFLYVSGMIAIYRLGCSALDQLLRSQQATGDMKKHKLPWLSIMKQPLLQIIVTAIAWIALYFIDSIRLIGDILRNEIHNTNDYVNFIPDNVSLYSYTSSDPVSAVMIANAVITPVVALMIILAYAITRRIHFKEGSGATKRGPFRFLAADQAGAIVGITGCFLLLASLIVAVTRWPFDQAVARSIKRVFQHYHVKGSENMCNPAVKYSCTLLKNAIFDPAPVVNLFSSEGKFDGRPFFYLVFAKQLSGGLMGLFPYAINYMAGAFMGLLLVLFKRSASSVRDNAPRVVLDRKQEARVLWSWNGIYMSVLAAAFGIWLAIYPYHPFGEYRPWAYNGPFILSRLGLQKDGHELVTEWSVWHTGAYELELTVLQIICGTILVYWCEFSKVATKICREDGAFRGLFPFIRYKRGEHVPLRFLRRFSTYSTSVFYFFDNWIYSILYRLAQLLVPQCTGKCSGLGIFFPMLVMPACVVLFLWLEDSSLGFISVDFLVTLAMKVSVLLLTIVMMPIARFKQMTRSPHEFAGEYRRALAERARSIFVRPPYCQHTGIRVERFYPMDMDLKDYDEV